MGSRHFIFFDEEYWMHVAWIQDGAAPPVVAQVREFPFVVNMGTMMQRA